MKVESSKGEAWPGQHEINFRYADALEDRRRPRRLQDGAEDARAPVRDVGHLHGEARPHVGRLVVPHPLVALARRRVRVRRRDATSSSTTSPARSRARRSSRSSSRRRSTRTSGSRRGSWAPTTLAWATTTARAATASSGTARRCAPETRIPGADANPYLAFAALLAAGLYGIEEKLELGPAFEGNAYESDVERFPNTMRDAIDAARARHARAAAARRRGRRPLPELRAHRAAALRRGRHELRAGADVRAWLSPSSGSRPTSRTRRGGTGSSRRRSSPTTTCARSSARAARALLVPPDADGVEETLDALDGLLFSGGNDLDPTSYGAEAHAETSGTKPERDRGELALLEGALARDMPMLAVCRGFQVLNVARGGDLVQHLPDAVGHEQHREVKGVFSEHGVKIDDASRLGVDRRRARARSKSHHHQGVGRVGEGLREVRVGRRRHDRGARGSREALRRRRALASGGGGGPEALRGARRRGAPRTGRSADEHGAEPRDGGAARGARGRGRRGDRRGGRAREGGVPGVARGRAGGSRAVAAPAGDARRGEARGALAHRVAQRRQADQRRARRGRHGRAGLPLLRGRGRQALRRDDPRRGRRRHDVPRAARRRRADHAVELPAQHRVVEDRAGARLRQHDRDQAGRADAALDRCGSASSRSRRASPRAC